jgi:hypothetical protein
MVTAQICEVMSDKFNIAKFVLISSSKEENI